MRNDSASLGWVLRTVSFNKRPSDVDPVFLRTVPTALRRETLNLSKGT